MSPSSRSYSLALVLTILIANTNNRAYGAAVGHSHHNKRQSMKSTPMLTLDVEPHAGILPTHPQAPVPEYLFPVDAGLFNFTCTIKHPGFFNKLVITRERLLNNGQRGPPEDLIDSNNYVLNSAIKDPRISLEFFDPSQLVYLDPTVQHVRASLLIKNLKLEDNAIYTCKYSDIIKKINTVVYKQAHIKDLIFPSLKIEKFQLNKPVSVVCQINDVYPRPKLSFSAPNRDDLSKNFEEKDITKEPTAESNLLSLQSIQSTLKFTPEYTDHGQTLNCSVTSQSATNNTLNKSLKIQVEGEQIIEDKCIDYYSTKVGDIDMKIECVYFSNPKEEAYFEAEEEDLGDETEVDQEDQAEKADPAKKAEKRTKTVEIKDGDENVPNFSLFIEKFGESRQGMYKAVLTIKDVTEKNLKSYKFKLKDLEREIRLGTASSKDIRKESSIGEGSSASSLFKLHSKVCVTLIATLVFLRIV